MTFYYFGGESRRYVALQRMKDVVAEHSARIREIHLRGIEGSQLATLLDGIPDSSLQLTSLVLTTSNDHNYTLPITIMGDLLRLEYLHIAGIHFPWYSQPLCALTHLRIECTPEPAPITSFFAALRAMSALQVLHLGSLPATCDTRDVDPLSFRNLRYLHLHSPTGLSNLLSVFAVPTETVIDLDCIEPESRFASSLSGFFSSMGFGTCKRPSYRNLKISGPFPLLITSGRSTYLHNYP